MSIRLRKVEGVMVALCAARTTPHFGDMYLDDEQHYALAAKFSRDRGGTRYSPEHDIMDRLEVADD